MKFKYFHGTSTIFLDSIQKHGLGTLNPNIDYKNLDVLIYLKNIAEKELINNKEYSVLRDATLAMANQTSLIVTLENGEPQKLNYKHDGIYVALSRERAAIYASLNKYGSEILEKIIQLYKLLKKENIDFQIPKSINLFNIENYLDCNPEPIIIEISEIEDVDLEKEDGKTAKEALEFLREVLPSLSEKEKYEFLQFCNFKILKPIESKLLKFYSLDYQGHPAYNNFEFTLSEI